MRVKLFSSARSFGIAALCFLVLGASNAQAGDMKLEAQLLWGTDKSESPDPKHKQVEPEVREKLNKLPLKWTHYYLVNSEKFSVAAGKTRKVDLSPKCAVEVKAVDRSTIEVTLFGKGEQVMKRLQALPVGEILIIGGNAPGSTSWLVVVKRLE